MASHQRSRSSSTPSEGEIIESGPDLKATASKHPLNDSSVDRPPRDSTSSVARPQSSRDSRSPSRRSWTRSRSRSRSPYRESKGYKRRRYDEYDDYEDRPSRRYGSRYDDRHYDRDTTRRPRGYHDYDRQESSVGGLRYADDYDRRREKSRRTHSRSRSPYREVRKYKQYDDDPGRNGTVPSKQVVSERGKLSSSARDSRLDAEKNENQAQQGLPTRNAYVTDVADIHSKTEDTNQTEPAEPVDEEAALEARRKRREAIRAKYRSQATPLHLQALQVADADTDISTSGTDTGSVHETTDSPLISPTDTPKAQPDDVFSDFKIGNDSDLAKSNMHVDSLEKDEPSAADYDPTMDMKEDRSKHGHGSANGEVPSAAYDETQTSKQDFLIPDAAPKIPADAPKKDPYDMFAEDDDDDMFAEEKEEPTHASAKSAIPQAKELDISMMDNWDDPEGYYNVRLGELINSRYHVQQNLGKGMFSSVVRATDSTTGGLVAIKIIRQNDTMRKAGMKEIGILEQLREEDPEDKKHLIRFERFFDHKGHLCMVFENLSMNLREVLKKFGRDVGLNLRAIRTYAQQIFTGLALLRRCHILHADLKPDNLLVNDTRNILKVCDLGSASPASDNEITPYLVSRFYRAPEIILGIQYDYAIDVWSIGCTLFELYTGKILFTGRNNNQMLKSIMECRGKYPPKLLRRGSLAHLHFDDMLNFHSTEEDKVTGRLVTRIVDFKKPTRDLKTRLLGQGTRGLPDIEIKELNLFIDFLDRCLSLNPEKRCTPTEALKHPFLARK